MQRNCEKKQPNQHRRQLPVKQKAEDLIDENIFDLVWIPSVFIPSSAISEIVNRAYKALRSRGWVLFGMATRSHQQ